jgi:Ca2+-binding EF-hand superfamily protein
VIIFALMVSFSRLKAFSAFDKQRNGRIPGETLKYYLTSLGDPLSQREAEDLIKDAGGGDGLFLL